MGSISLFDGNASVSAEELALNMIKAALLANEHAGIIALEVEPGSSGSNGDTLIAMPTGKKVHWPAYTLEYRLVPAEKSRVAEIIKNWIIDKNSSPWNRAIILGKVMLTLRGFCKIVSTKWSGKKYILADDQVVSSSGNALRFAEELLNNCRTNHQQIWKLLDRDITSAVTSLKLANKNVQTKDIDPWLNESASDRERFIDQVIEKPIMLPPVLSVPFSVLFVGIDYWLTYQSKQYVFTIVTAILVSIGVIIFSFPTKRIKDLSIQFSKWLYAGLKYGGTIPDASSLTVADRIGSFIVAVPVLVMFVLLIKLLIVSHPVVALLILFSGWGLLYRLLQKKAGKAITSKVVNETTASAHDDSATASIKAAPVLADEEKLFADGGAVEVLSAIADTPPATVTLPVEMEIITRENIAPASEECLKILTAIALRSSSHRNVYRKGILFLSFVTVLLSIINKIHLSIVPLETFKANPEMLLKFLPVFQTFVLVLTMIFLSPRAVDFIKISLVRMFMKNIEITKTGPSTSEGNTKKTASIRFVGLHLMGGFWVIIAIQNIFSYTAPPEIMELFLTTGSVVSTAFFLYRTLQQRRVLEKLYPYHPPLNLLALRVFGSSALNDFLELSNSWQWIGTRQLLDGPDTTGHKINDLINYFTGRIDHSIVKNSEELKQRNSQFKTQPDRELRFPVNSMQCNNATWKEALQLLLDSADVVVVDLSDLSEKNQGIAYELEKLLNEIELKRIVFLLNDSTDTAVLNNILMKAFSKMSENNFDTFKVLQKVSFFSMGGLSSRYQGESAYEWKHRQSRRMNETSLVNLLYTAATPARNPVALDVKRDANLIKWTRIPMPTVLRRIIYFFIYTYLIIASLAILNYLSHFNEK